MEKKNLITLREADGSIINMEIHDKLVSTSALAKEYAVSGYPDRYIVYAENLAPASPSAKHKHDTPQRGIHFSCILRPSIFPSQASLLGHLSATAFVTALSEHTKKQLGIGWISDIFCQGEKIGGVTIEGKLDSYTTYEYIIITFEAKLNENDFPPRLGDLVRKVFEIENTSIPMIIARNVLSKFFKLYSTLKSSSKFMDVYAQHFILRGKRIKHTEGGKKRRCKVLGIDPKSGGLIIEMKNKTSKTVTSPSSVIIPKRIRIQKKK